LKTLISNLISLIIVINEDGSATEILKRIQTMTVDFSKNHVSKCTTFFCEEFK